MIFPLALLAFQVIRTMAMHDARSTETIDARSRRLKREAKARRQAEEDSAFL